MMEERCTSDQHWLEPGSPAGTKCQCGETTSTIDDQRGAFAKGNEAAVTHGAGIPGRPRPKIIAEVQQEADELIDAVSHLTELDRGSVVALKVADRAIERLVVWIFGEDERPEDETRGAEDLLRRWLMTRKTLAGSLGLQPLDRAKLKLDTAETVSIVDQLERGRQARIEREKRGELPPAA